jgi:hypothetical protein
MFHLTDNADDIRTIIMHSAKFTLRTGKAIDPTRCLHNALDLSAGARWWEGRLGTSRRTYECALDSSEIARTGYVIAISSIAFFPGQLLASNAISVWTFFRLSPSRPKTSMPIAQRGIVRIKNTTTEKLVARVLSIPKSVKPTTVKN